MDSGDATAGSGMSAAIFAKLKPFFIDTLPPGTPASVSAENEKRLKELAFAIADGVISHIVSSMEIAGVTVGLDGPPSQTVETFVAGVGTEGGALVAGAFPVVGSIRHGATTNMSGTQSNDGTGRVS